MKWIITLICGIILVFCCSKKEKPITKAEESIVQTIIVDKELGEGSYYKDFLNAIKNQDCNTIFDL